MLNNLKRNPQKVLADLTRTSSGQYVTKSGCRIQVPKRTEDRGLTMIGVRTYCFGQCAIILDSGDYGFLNVIGRIEIAPSSTKIVTIDGVDYYEFQFEPGDIVIVTEHVVKDDKILYYVLDEFVFQSKTPWYMSYNDRLNLFLSVKEHVGLTAGDVPEIIEVMASITMRSHRDESLFMRQDYRGVADETNAIFTPFDSVQDSVSTTVDRIAGSYLEPAIVGGLVTPSRKANRIERILRA